MESEKVKEIKKGLECCKENEDTNSLAYCHRCPFGGHVSCEQELYQKSLTLINELESENKKYKKKLTTNEWVKEIRKSAFQEFAEKLKAKLFDLGNVVTENDIDETLKEFKK